MMVKHGILLPFVSWWQLFPSCFLSYFSRELFVEDDFLRIILVDVPSDRSISSLFHLRKDLFFLALAIESRPKESSCPLDASTHPR